jgi:ribosomal protein S18 acetylase RimI-like enzyme
VTTVSGLPVVSLGLPERWANVVLALEDMPESSRVADALAFFADRDVVAQVLVREAAVDMLPGLRPVDVMPVYVVPVSEARTEDSGGLLIEPTTDSALFTSVYGGAFEMRPGMAEALVDPTDMTARGALHLVARLSERADPVGCALLRSAGGLGYVSAVGVVPNQRGRGIGTSLLEACASRAAAGGCSEVWLHASESSRTFYEGLGYELADTHVALA